MNDDEAKLREIELAEIKAKIAVHDGLVVVYSGASLSGRQS